MPARSALRHLRRRANYRQLATVRRRGQRRRGLPTPPPSCSPCARELFAFGACSSSPYRSLYPLRALYLRYLRRRRPSVRRLFVRRPNHRSPCLSLRFGYANDAVDAVGVRQELRLRRRRVRKRSALTEPKSALTALESALAKSAFTAATSSFA